MKSRRLIIALLVVVLIGILIYNVVGIQPAENRMDPEKLTVIATPEQEEAMIHPDFIQEEYVPIIPEGTNIASEGKIEASGFNDVYTPRKAKDGQVEGASYWEGDALPVSLWASFDTPRQPHTMRLRLNPDTVWGSRSQTIAISYSQDGEVYEDGIEATAYDFDPATGNEVLIPIERAEIMGIRLTFSENTGAASAQLAEWEIYE